MEKGGALHFFPPRTTPTHTAGRLDLTKVEARPSCNKAEGGKGIESDLLLSAE